MAQAQAWQYMTLLINADDNMEDVDDTLSSWGGRGWEAVGMVQQMIGQSGQSDSPSGLWASTIIVLLKRPA